MTRRTRITWALGLSSVYLVAELVGGILANSLALLADAGHMATDVGALALALWAMRLAERPPTATRTYGYHRAEILAAMVNAATLLAVSAYILWEAFQRFRAPAEVAGPLMLWVATGGLVVNAVAMALLHGGQRDSLNVRAAWLHVLGDALGSVAVLVGAVLVIAFDWFWADPLAGALIALLIVVGSWRLLRETTAVLMAGIPAGIDPAALERDLEEVSGVVDVHDLHIWTLTSGIPLLTAHVDVTRQCDRPVALASLQGAAERFGIHHTTFQLESEDERCAMPDCSDGLRAGTGPHDGHAQDGHAEPNAGSR